MENNDQTMENNQQTMADNEQTLEVNQLTMEDNQQQKDEYQQILKDYHQTMEDNQQTMQDNQKTMEDNQLTMEDNQITMEDTQLTMEDNRITMEDNQITMEQNEITMEQWNKISKKVVDNQHFANSVHTCDDCGKIFSEKEKMRNHKSYTHRIEVSVCSICGSEFQNKQKLQKHINARHKDKGLHCDMCVKVFKNNSDLYGHKMKVHEEIENLACEKCGVKKMNNFKLKRHMRKSCPGFKHTQENLYCIECNKTFESIRSFNGHNKLAHSNDPIHFYDPVKCPICQKDSKNISYFRQHLKRAHKIVDPNHTLSLIKDVKPELEEVIIEKKVDNVSKYQKHRSDLIKKWKEIEKENNEKINVEKMTAESDENKHGEMENVTSDIKMEELEEVKSEPNDELHMKKQRHKCADCGKLFSRANKLNNHIKLVHTHEPCTCPFCGSKTLKNKSDLSMHIKNAHKDFKLPKEETTIMYDEDKLQLNEVLVDETKQNIKHDAEMITDETAESQKNQEPEINNCRECGKSFFEVGSFNDHIKTAHIFEPCACPICEGTLLKNKTYLARHLEQFHKGYELPKENINKINEEQEIKMIQDTLNECFETSIELKQEITETVIEDLKLEKPFMCDLCLEIFTTKSTFEQHKLIHKGEKSLQCDDNDQEVKNAVSLRQLQRNSSEQGDNEIERICEQCGKTCKNKRALVDHTRGVHLGKKGPTGIFKCSECNKEFGRRHALYNHKYYTHMIQNIVCPSCGKTCKNKMSLTRHMKRTCSSV